MHRSFQWKSTFKLSLDTVSLMHSIFNWILSFSHLCVKYLHRFISMCSTRIVKLKILSCRAMGFVPFEKFLIKLFFSLDSNGTVWNKKTSKLMENSVDIRHVFFCSGGRTGNDTMAQCELSAVDIQLNSSMSIHFFFGFVFSLNRVAFFCPFLSISSAMEKQNSLNKRRRQQKLQVEIR